MMKKIVTFFVISILLVFPGALKADQSAEIESESKVEIVLFTSSGCPHCTTAKNFLESLKSDYIFLETTELDLSRNTKLVNDFYEEYSVPSNRQGLIPAIFIKNTDVFFVGFNSQIGEKIEDHLKGLDTNNDSQKITIPLVGEVDVLDVSMPILAVLLGIVDGFNVCSLGALVVILGIVMVLKSRKRILLMGGIFILVTVISYSFLMFLWHRLFSFIAPYVRSMEILIAILALSGGVYLMIEFIKSMRRGPKCSSGGIIAKLSPKVEKIFSQKKNIFLLSGVVALFALAVTVIEFPCSAFLPALFTSLLVEGDYSMSASLGYIALFLFFYMLAEIIIFTIAVLTLRIKIVSPGFIKFFSLIASLIFLFLGIHYLFRIS
jgi:glutaredoxin